MKGLLTTGIDCMFREHLSCVKTTASLQKYIIIMSRAISNNLETVSKKDSKNEVNVEVFVDNKYSKITHTFKIPFKKLEEPIQVRLSIYEVLDTFSDVLINALEERMESCVDMLSRNLFNVVESNEYHILFKKDDGSYHSFNHPSFKVMQDAVRLIKDGKTRELGKMHYDQIIKALYWVAIPAPRNGISFGNLISACMEIITVS